MSVDGGSDRPLLGAGPAASAPYTPDWPSRPRTGGDYGSVSHTFSMGATDADDDAAAVGAVKAVHKNALGTFNGCFIPCCLNIMGVILFLKIGWGIGNAGVVGMLLIFAIAETLCILTVLSLSAIITNGDMAGGGSYYMISRSLGPEFGGAIGILFYVAYAFGASFYFIGFAEGVALFSFVQPFICETDTDTGCLSTDNFNRVVGLFALIVCFGTAWGGAEVRMCDPVVQACPPSTRLVSTRRRVQRARQLSLAVRAGGRRLSFLVVVLLQLLRGPATARPAECWFTCPCHVNVHVRTSTHPVVAATPGTRTVPVRRPSPK